MGDLGASASDNRAAEEEAMQKLAAAAFEDRKPMFWMGDMIQCFGSMLSIFGASEYKITNDSDWEVPYDDIKDLVYVCSGAQGMVYSGNLRGEIVAVKKVRHRYETNVKHLRKLNHENLVRFRGVCVEEPDYCLIMEYCQYGSLYDFLGKGNLLPKQMVQWAKDIASGMQYLHSHKIIHRDLKSPNVLIADDLVVKVTDFGTSRVWDNVSTIMTFNGTVAWMAPEVIRQEPCSERVDVWSYGVVLWELLTKEIPYKNMETPSIMWGVGTDTLSLPIPVTCPNSVQMLLCQCWNRVPKNRPPFKIIQAHLEMAASDILSMDPDTFASKQAIWGEEVRDGMARIFERSEKQLIPGLNQPKGRDDLRQVQQVYEQQLSRANELYMEVCAVRLQLEERERMIAQREKQLKTCRCGLRRNFKLYRQISTSSDGKSAGNDSRRRRRRHEAQLLVNYIEGKEGTVTVALEDPCKCSDSILNNNMPKETIVEENGNVDIHHKDFNDHLIPDVAQV